MTAGYGFTSTVTARPGQGERLTRALLTALDDGNPASSEHCVVFLVSRSAANPDVVHVTEGWTSEEAHDRVFAGPAARAIVSRLEDLVADQSPYTDFVPVGGKAVF